ncbi:MULTISPECIES: hypothetical protein [Streptomyces]
MSLQARQFFAELCLPFTDSTVVGNTYYAHPYRGSHQVRLPQRQESQH